MLNKKQKVKVAIYDTGSNLEEKADLTYKIQANLLITGYIDPLYIKKLPKDFLKERLNSNFSGSVKIFDVVVDTKDRMFKAEGVWIGTVEISVHNSLSAVKEQVKYAFTDILQENKDSNWKMIATFFLREIEIISKERK
ncbi:MAG: hypothetical protein JXI43_13000 [Tissierellales bacterium]|nr:hypothetical protein [Tissierellales bacterium]